MTKVIYLVLVAAMASASCTKVTKEQTVVQAPVKKLSIEKASVYMTAKDTDLRLTKVSDTEFNEYGQPLESQAVVWIDPQNTFQTMVGIGAALTDASAVTFAKLPEDKQQELLTAYYDKEKGIGYNFSRTNIASCDFSVETYNYIEEGDTELKTFNVKHDEVYRIPFIKKAIEAAGGELPMFVSPWSPPAWMKSNKNSLQGGTLLEEYKEAWANHYVKFIETYEALGIPIWGLSVQNEPMAVQTWESCVYTAEEERDFIKKYLGPALEKGGMADRNLIAWDHNRDQIYQRASTILNDPEAAKYVWGIGFHWYEPWTGGDMQFDNLKMVNQAFPDKKLIFTEGCIERFGLDRVYDWSLGERYGYSMLNDFNSGTVAWTDWNILLDETGGPNHVGNFCFAPVHGNTQTGELIYTNSYYYIGHFSKFIESGAKRIACSSSRDLLQASAFQNPDGEIVVVVLNRTEGTFNYKLCIDGKAADAESLPHSITTFIL